MQKAINNLRWWRKFNENGGGSPRSQPFRRMKIFSETFINTPNKIKEDPTSSKTGKTLEDNRLFNDKPKHERRDGRHISSRVIHYFLLYSNYA